MNGSGWTAMLPAAAVVIGALLAALLATSRERTSRRETSQREALYLLQTSCSAYRRALTRFAGAETTIGPELEAARDAVSDALQDLDLVEARILSDTVLARFHTWRGLAKRALLNDDMAPVSATEENDAWLAVQRAVQSELRRLSSPGLWPRRGG